MYEVHEEVVPTLQERVELAQRTLRRWDARLPLKTKLLLLVGLPATLVFLGYFLYYSTHPEVNFIRRSEEVRDLWKTPRTAWFNPFRERGPERPAVAVIEQMRSGQCAEALASWMRDYRRDYARKICEWEQQHPIRKYTLVDREDTARGVNLHYLVRRTSPKFPDGYEEHVFVTSENRDGPWKVTKYDAVY